MDPITAAILAALAAGVVDGVTKVGEKVITDAYEALKGALNKKYGADSKIVKAVGELESEPNFKSNQDALAGRVAEAHAAADPELQRLAQALLAALQTTAAGKAAAAKFQVHAPGAEIGVIGDGTTVEGGIHFGRTK